MYFAIFCTDRPGTAELRLKTRPVHREYLHATHEGVKLCLAGPTLAADGTTMNGTLIVVEADTLARAEAFAAGDPYRQADLFESVVIRPWNWTTGRPGEQH